MGLEMVVGFAPAMSTALWSVETLMGGGASPVAALVPCSLELLDPQS